MKINKIKKDKNKWKIVHKRKQRQYENKKINWRI